MISFRVSPQDYDRIQRVGVLLYADKRLKTDTAGALTRDETLVQGQAPMRKIRPLRVDQRISPELQTAEGIKGRESLVLKYPELSSQTQSFGWGI